MKRFNFTAVFFMSLTFAGGIMDAGAYEKIKLNKLTAAQERVIKYKGTEKPFSGEYNDFFKPGVYLCRQCNAPLYRSDDKFRTTCGWPGYDDEISGAVKRVADPDGRRTEIVCRRCGGHLGHVFNGENLTQKNTRHCVNSVSLKFAAGNSKLIGRAIFAGGCFWGIEHLMQKAPGVINVVSGYTGGISSYPDYRSVCGGTTGHTEAVEVFFDPAKTSYEKLVKLFFEIHNPESNKKTQYQSAIFYTCKQQKTVAEKIISMLKKRGLKIVTVVKPACRFYPAENYHQNYYKKSGSEPRCLYRNKLF